MPFLERLVTALWGPCTLALFICAGVFLTYRCGAVQFRHAYSCIIGTLRRLRRGGSGGMSGLQALSTALGGTVGTGNIAGVTLALSAGGPGVLFWMWVSGLLGMAIKYSEVLLAVKFRERGQDGARRGGPMYYIVNGLGRRARPLACVFAAAGALSAFGIGSAVQSGEMRSALSGLFSELEVPVGPGFPWAVGLLTAMLAAAVLLGGAERLGKAAGILVPFMSLAYIAACCAVLAANASRLLPCLLEVMTDAFQPRAGLGACVGWGFRRGIFSNEAGLGSSPIAHAAGPERDCVRQGMAGVFEVFADTIVICTLTGLTLLASGALEGAGAGETPNAAAFAGVMGAAGSAAFIAFSIVIFAFSSMLSWGFYGASCCEFILGGGSRRPYAAAFCAAALFGAAGRLDGVWLISDILNALMAAPNMAAVLALSGVVCCETRRYFQNQSPEGR